MTLSSAQSVGSSACSSLAPSEARRCLRFGTPFRYRVGLYGQMPSNRIAALGQFPSRGASAGVPLLGLAYKRLPGGSRSNKHSPFVGVREIRGVITAHGPRTALCKANMRSRGGIFLRQDGVLVLHGIGQH